MTTATSTTEQLVRPALRAERAYATPAWPGPIDLRLDANEGPPAIDIAALAAAMTSQEAARYPSARDLEREIAAFHAVAPERVIVTAGADDAIDRLCRATLEPGASMVTTTPTFEMIARGGRLAGAEVRAVPWLEGDFPTDAVIESADEGTRMIAVVSPNNPTGAVATAADLSRLSAAWPGAALLIDLAYTEFAAIDLTRAALDLPNAVVTRTFSKAYGLAGMRVGYAIGPGSLIQATRATGGPYPCSGFSLRAARAALRVPVDVGTVVARRGRIADSLARLGTRVIDSQANFVMASFGGRTRWVWRALCSLGIKVRAFDEASGLGEWLRIGVPASDADEARLLASVQTALAPAALLFDMDGVLADVSRSYRRAIVDTAASFGVGVTPEDIERAKARGNANNDWMLTRDLLASRGVEVSLARVTERFQALYLGTPGSPGFEAAESLIPDASLLRRLARRMPLAVVTGRPREECRRFLDRFGIADLFRACVCMEDAAPKPSPDPVRLALRRLGLNTAWMFGDTPDDAAAARGAGVVPIGFLGPACNSERARAALVNAGVAEVLSDLEQLERLLP